MLTWALGPQEDLCNSTKNLTRYFQYNLPRAFWKSAHPGLCGNSCDLSWWRRSTRNAAPVTRRLQFCSSFHLVAISSTRTPHHRIVILYFDSQRKPRSNKIMVLYTTAAAQLLAIPNSPFNVSLFERHHCSAPIAQIQLHIEYRIDHSISG